MAKNADILAGPPPERDPSFGLSADQTRQISERKNHIVTCAQNNTPPVKGFWKAIEHYSEHRESYRSVIPHRYRNPTNTVDGERDKNMRWDPAFDGFLVGSQVELHPLVQLMGQTRIQATVDNPVPASRHSQSRAASAIYGHPQLTLQSVPTPQSELPKLIYTTGSATEMNYSTTGRGDLAKFHHTAGAIVVEARGEKFFMREVVWDGKGFYDHEHYYTARGVRKAGRLEVLYMGDLHRRFMDPGVDRATFGPGGIVETKRPKEIVVGDVADGISINHHDQGKMVLAAWRAKQHLDCCEAELDQVIEWLNYASKFARVWVTPSNHDDFLMRWLNGSDRHVEPINFRVFNWLRVQMMDELEKTGRGNPLELYCRGKVDPKRVQFLKVDQSLRIRGIECGMHGHLGPNGARGSAANLARIGTKSIIGHSHSPRIWQGVYQVGTSSIFNLGYTSGPSSWFHTHAGIYPNGRRQMIHMIDGEWRG